MLRDQAIRNKLLGVLGFVIVLQASVIGWSLMSSPVGASEAIQPQDLQILASRNLAIGGALIALCDVKRGNLIYFSAVMGTSNPNHNLVVVENGCPKGVKF